MNWFGEPWPSAELRAPVCEDEGDKVPNPPPGELCVLCGLTFADDARGVRMPHITAHGQHGYRYSHLGCLLGNVGGEGVSWREG